MVKNLKFCKKNYLIRSFSRLKIFYSTFFYNIFHLFSIFKNFCVNSQTCLTSFQAINPPLKLYDCLFSFHYHLKLFDHQTPFSLIHHSSPSIQIFPHISPKFTNPSPKSPPFPFQSVFSSPLNSLSKTCLPIK